MPKHRIFVAIDVPDKLKNIIGEYLGPFYKNSLARVVKKENWHITVVFCGYLDEERLSKLKGAAENIVRDTKKFELVPTKIIFKNNRMVWATFKPSPEFLKLGKRFFEFSQKTREQSLHLTLVRFEEKHYSDLKRFLPQEGVDLKNKADPFWVESLSVMESHLSHQGRGSTGAAPDGPKYELLCRNYLK